ncbi:hypothetical protein ES703_109204 [subsurface metagenome]
MNEAVPVPLPKVIKGVRIMRIDPVRGRAILTLLAIFAGLALIILVVVGWFGGF